MGGWVLRKTAGARGHAIGCPAGRSGTAQANGFGFDGVVAIEGVVADRMVLALPPGVDDPLVGLQHGAPHDLHGEAAFRLVGDAVDGKERPPRPRRQIEHGLLSPQRGRLGQSNYVAHTKADGWHRLVTPAQFTGTIAAGRDYFLMDDHVGFGGTLANLRGTIELGGGQVIGMSTLTETRDAHKIAVRQQTLLVLQEKHGQELEQFWSAVFGHGLACLTDIEAGYLSRVESVAAIQTRMAQAAAAARGRGVPAIGLPQP